VKVAKLKQLEYGRVQLTVYDEDNVAVDVFIGDNADDAITAARREHKIELVTNREEYTHPNDGSFTDIDAVVREILEETEQLRQARLLPPFVEGTPIGTIPLHHRADLKRKRRRKKK